MAPSSPRPTAEGVSACPSRSEEHTSELQSQSNLVCRLLLEKTDRSPHGAKDGATIKLTGRGEPGPPGSRPGDLFVRVRVAPHPMFGRRDSDLTLELPITFAEAALGANVQGPTLDGALTLKIPPGTKPGKTFRIRGTGVPKAKGGAGDLLVTVQVDVPPKLSKEERDLLRRLQEVQKEWPRSRLGVES